MMAGLSGPMLPPASGDAPRQAVVLLHGYGSDGNDLIGLGQMWAAAFPDALFVAPNAPAVCADNPAGYEWFPLPRERPVVDRRPDSAAKVRPVVIQFLDDLWAQTGLGPEQTVLAGFSQGAMMALHTGLSLDRRLAGILAFSGALLPPEGFPQAETLRPPVALVHGEFDEVVEAINSRQAKATLEAAGYDVSLHVSPGIGHSISTDGLQFASEFLARAFAA
jgi:phospholipase/carboxylesterase